MDAHILYETGWSPEVLDAQPIGRVRAYLLYRQVRSVHENGGELIFGDEPKRQKPSYATSPHSASGGLAASQGEPVPQGLGAARAQ